MGQTNRDVLSRLSNAKIARLLVKFGIQCKGCPAREDCAAVSWLPCEIQLELWLGKPYEGKRPEPQEGDRECQAKQTTPSEATGATGGTSAEPEPA